MKISRNAILKNAGPLLENAPEKIYGLVARLLDEKELTEAKEAELKRQADAMKSLYYDQKGRFQEAVRENGVLTRLPGGLRGKVESLTLDCARFKAKFEEAIGRIGQLEDALADAREEGGDKNPDTNKDDPARERRSYSADSVTREINNRTKDGGKGKKRREPRKAARKDKIFDTVTDVVYNYKYDIGELNRKYGETGYRIIDFECTRELRETRPHNYEYRVYTPVIVVNTEEGGEKILSEGNPGKFYPGSFASLSLVASVMYKRYGLALPLYRLEQEYSARNVLLTRQTMCNWILKFGLETIGPVYDWIEKEFGEQCTVQQCDETTWPVIIWPEEDDGARKKANGSKGYVWVHTSSGLGSGRKIILYSFEKSRSADHLRRTLSGLVTYLVSDAYAGYIAMEKERGGSLSVANCWMHCRKAWARACVVMKKSISEMTMEELLEEPAVKGLMLANDIFAADKPLKSLEEGERKEKRMSDVAPLVEKFFSFVHSIDLDDPKVMGKLREAVIYSLNQEERLKVFLQDGRIPLDNGFCERCVKPIALARKNSMFSYSMDGAKCNAIIHSVVETAKANGADVYTYLKYILSEVPKHLDGKDREFLAEMMPWSAAYRAYEKQELLNHADERVPESNTPPAGMKFIPKDKRIA